MIMKPGFDAWTTFFALAALFGLLAAGWFFRNKNHRIPFRWLGWLVLLFAVTLSEWVLWWTGYIEQFTWFKAISYPFILVFGVLLLGYYRSAFPDRTSGNRPENKPLLSWLHFLPAIVCMIKMFPTYLYFQGIRIWDWGQFTFISRSIDGFYYLALIHLALYPLWIYRRYKPRFAADPELMRWHRWMLRAYGGIVAAFWVHHTLTLLSLMTLRLDFLIAFFIVLFMGLVVWLGRVQPRILAGLPFRVAILPVKYQKSALSPEAARDLAARIRDCFEQNKVYLDPELTLETLARQLGSSRHHVSQAINREFGVGFSELLARRRIQEAQALLIKFDRNELIIKEIAYDSGFNTKAAFNLTFKKYTGMTPTEFRNQAKGR